MAINSEYNGVVMHFNRIVEYGDNNTISKAILLSHPLYFLQNGYNEVINDGLGNTDVLKVDNIKAGKTLLLLHSLPFNYGSRKIKSFFNSKDSDNAGYEVVPYGYLALIGGVLYRRRMIEKTGKDIVYTGDIYKNPGKDGVFLINDGTKTSFGIIKYGSTKQYQSYQTIVSDEIDLYIENKLIALFLSFVNETSYLLDDIEIKRKIQKHDKYDVVNFTYNTYGSFVSQMNPLNVNDINKVLRGENTFIIDSLHNTIVGFNGTYEIGFINEAKLMLYYKETNVRVQSLFDKLYNHKSGVLSLVVQSTPDRSGSVKTSTFKNIINGFANTIVELSQNNGNETENETTKDISTSKNSADVDLKKSIYLYMKQFWDKWLCSTYNNINSSVNNKIRPFSVEWFKKQFLFIDTFYNDVSCTLKLNCSILLELYQTSKNSESPSGVHVYNHLANVAERHYCNFFCYPDFIHFAKHDSNGHEESPEQILSDIFKPIPYNKINPVEVENQFVIIRNTSAQINGNASQFVNDGFDIWTSDSGTDIVPSTFKSSKNGYNEAREELRMAYKVPSFGVAYSRQNNSLFKSIDIGMDTVQITEQSIKTMAYISQQGNSSKRAVTFYGNDIYGVYSAYSYIVTITMMGDAQIQPLMYFQLMNIPLFRGTYMIIEVKHSIRAGEFTTTFRGMKMSRIEMPINSSWFTIEPESSEANNNDSGNECGNGLVDSNGNVVSTDTYTVKEDVGIGDVETYLYNFNPTEFRLANKFSDANVGIPYGPNHNKIPMVDECPDIKLMCVGASFVYDYDYGRVVGVTVVNGKVLGTFDMRDNMGGFVVYKDKTARICLTSTDFKCEVDSGNVLYGFQNFRMVGNGKVNMKLSGGTYIFQCIGERYDGTFVFITTTKPYSYNRFAKYVDGLKLKNALYLDTNNFACYGWSRTKMNKINGDSSKIKNKVFYWGGYVNDNATSTIIYMV